MENISREGGYVFRTKTLEEGVSHVAGLLEKEGFPRKGDDYISVEKKTISIDDIRRLQEFHEETSLSGAKTIICAGSFITTQAQNALLKMIEEPKNGERIFLIVSYESELLETIISRVQKYSIKSEISAGQIEEFVKLAEPKRISYMEEKILSIEESDEKRDALLTFLRELEEYLHSTNNLVQYKDLLKAIPTLRQMLGNQGAPVKMIAEYVALAF
jgi:DNA polymerase III gamma/tau subunit